MLKGSTKWTCTLTGQLKNKSCCFFTDVPRRQVPKMTGVTEVKVFSFAFQRYDFLKYSPISMSIIFFNFYFVGHWSSILQNLVFYDTLFASLR